MINVEDPVGDHKPVVDLDVVASKAGDLPALPGMALNVLQLTKDPNTSARQLEEVIKRDQALAARILKLVNSAMYGLRREVTSISHAVAILGMEAVRSVVMAAAMQSLIKNGMNKGSDLGVKLLWDHSAGAAMACRTIANLVRYKDPEEAFLCGLMHDIGKPVLLQNFPREYTQVFSRVYRGGTSFHRVEMEMFGFSHAHLGAVVAQKWNFPRPIWSAIQLHHEPTGTTAPGTLAAIAALANLVMIQMEVGFEKDASLELDKEPAAAFLDLDKTAVEIVLTQTRKALENVPAITKS